MKVRAKMKVRGVEPVQTLSPGEVCAVVTLEAVTSDTPENKTWSKWTPNGTLSLTITNPSAIGVFKTGDEYFIDITPAALAR